MGGWRLGRTPSLGCLTGCVLQHSTLPLQLNFHLVGNLDLTSSSATTTSAWNTHTHTCTTPSHTLSSCYGSSQAHSVNSTNRHAHPACLCRRATHRACHCPGGRPSQPSTSKSVQIHFMSTSIGVWRLTSVLSQCLQLSATHKTQQ